MMRLLRDTRQQIVELRQRTESALAFVRQVSCTDRRREIQTVKARLRLLDSRLAHAVARQGLKWAGSHRVADPAHFDLPRLYRVSQPLVMATLCNRGALYICPVISSFYLSFFPRLISAVAD